MGAKDVYEKLQREKKVSDSKSKRVYAQLMQSKIVDEYNSLVQHNSDFFNKTKSRFYDEEDNYIDIYRPDSEDWKNTAVSLSSSAREKSNKIRSLLDEYGNYYDADFVNDITKSLNEHDKFSSDIASQAISQYDYFSQYKNEEDYNQKVVIPKKQHEEWAAADIETLETELAAWEKEWNAWQTGANSTEGHPEWQSQEWRYNNDGQKTIPYEATSFPKVFMGKTITEAKQIIDDRKSFIDNAKRVQEGIKMEGVNDPESEYYDADFDKYTEFTEEKGKLIPRYKDLVYNYVNGVKDGDVAMAQAWGKISDFELDRLEAIDEMTDDERDIYNYFYQKNGYEDAEKYLDTIMDSLNMRVANKDYDAIKDNALLEYIHMFTAGVDNANQGFASLLNGEGKYRPISAMQYAAGMVREDLVEDYGTFGQVTADLTQNIGNMAPSILVGRLAGNLGTVAGLGTKAAGKVGQVTGAAAMGASAMGNSYQEMLNQGYDKNRAKAYGTLVGASEAGLQYLLGGITSLGGTASGGITNTIANKLISNIDNAFLKVVAGSTVKLVGACASEFTEEYLQEVLDPVFKKLTLGTNEDVKLFSTEALYAGILGALSAGLLEGGSTISGEVNTYKAGKNVKNTGQLSNLKKLGTSYSADTVAYKIASQVNENTDAYTIGQLLHEVGADSLSETNINDISNALVKEGMTPEHADTIAKWLDSAVQGEIFNPLQRLALNNPVISKVFKEVIIDQNSTVNQRMQAYNDVLMGIATEKANLKANAKAEKAKARAEKKGNKNAEHTEETKAAPFVPYSNEELAKRQALEEASNLSEGKSIPQSEKAIESKFESNLDGKTVNTKTGDDVNVSEIASINNGKMTLKLDNGETVDADDISFGSEDEAIIYSAVLDMGVNATIANSLVKNYNPSEKLSAKKYALGIKEAYKYGMYSIPMNEMSKRGFAADLNEVQRTHAYNLGKSDMAAKIEKAQKDVEKTVSGKGGIEGTVYFKGDTLALKEVQRESLKRMGLLSEILGVDFHVFESYIDKNGKRVYKDDNGNIKSAPNGFYKKDGKIYIDLNAGAKGQGIMIYTVAHELGHFIKGWSPAKFKILADFLMEQYGKKGYSVDDLVQAQIAKAKRNGRTINYDTAYEEVVCDSLELMLSDDHVYEKILELKSKDASIVKKIGEFFTKIIDSFKKLMQQYPPETPEGKLVSEMKDSFTELQNLFAEALVDASNNYQANNGQKNTTSEGGVKESQRLGGYFPDINVSTKDISIFGIKDINNLKEVKQKVYNYLLGKYVSNDKISKPIKNIDTNMDIYVYWGGIDETFGNANAYKNLYSKKKKIKLATMTSLAKLIKYGEVRSPESSNIYNPKSKNVYAYLTAPITVDGAKYMVNMDIKKTPSGNRFYVHTIKIADESPKSNNSSTKLTNSSAKDSIPQPSKKSQEKESGRENTIGERNLEDFADAKDTEGKTLFQYRAMESDEAIYRGMLKTANIMSDTEIDALFDTVDKAMDIIKDNLEILDYAWDTDIDDRAFNPVKPNSDSLYQVSVDFSTLCRKRLLQQAIQVQLQEALNKPLTREEGIAIRDALLTIQEEGRQIEVACALCYVESARMKSPAQIKKFLETREKVLKEFFATKSGGSIKEKIKQAEVTTREKLHKDNPNGIKGKDGTMLDPRTAPLKAMPKKYADMIRDAKRTAKESYKPTAEEQKIIDVAKGMTVSDFTSPEGLENLAKNYPQLFDAYTSYVRNATKSKGLEGDTWWRAGDSNSIGDTLIDNMNRENGLRSQSWSDFQVIHLLDYIAATIELSTRKAKMQAYTKVPDFVELLGNTGEMINLSLIPTRNFNGTLDFDSVEGMAFKEALRLRDKYHATAGTIAIGIDNKQIQMLLADSKIDYVIPYHKSGMAASIRKLMHIPTWSQYEEYQSEKKLSRDDAKRQAKKYGVKLLAESDSNYQKHPNFSDWFDITEARQIAKMENANPSDKAMQKKYGVMYGGYMAMQNAANNYLKLCAERGISPKFSHENADFTVEDNYWKLLIDRKMVDNVTGEVIEQQAVKPIFDQNEVLRILNDELERYPSIKADQDYATRKVTENFLSGNIKGGMSAEAIAKAMKKPVDNVAKVNILASVEDLKLSDRDSEGNTLTKEQQEYFKDSKVRDENGNLKVVYHSSKSDFTVFEDRFIGTGAGNSFGNGFYFSDDKIEEYGNSKPYYLSINNPYIINLSENRFIKDNEMEEVIKFASIFGVSSEEVRGWYKYYSGYVNQAKATISKIIDESESSELSNLKKLGYDGLVINNAIVGIDNKFMTTEYVVFKSNQAKLTTNTTPTTNPDIRYSDRDSAGNKLSEAQIEFFKDSKIRDEKGRLLAVYHGTKNAGFTMFSKTDEIGYFFAKSLKTAQTYSGGSKVIYAPDKNSKAISGAANYKVHLNIKKPYIIDGNGVNWNGLESTGEKVDISIKSSRWSLDDGNGNCVIKLTYGGKTYGKRVANANEFQDFLSQHLNKDMARAFGFAMDSLVDESGKGKLETQIAWDFSKSQKAKAKTTRDIVRRAAQWDYDGVIFKNVVDSGNGSKIKADDLYVAFHSNQIKSVNNLNPTSDPDIRYSDRDSKTADDIEKINQQLAKENIKLMEDVKNLKELVRLQGKETHGKMLKKSTVELVAKRLMAYSNAKGNVSELVGYLTDVYSYIMQGEDVSWEGIQEKSQDAVDWLIRNEYHKPVRDELATEILSNLRGKRISLSENQKAEAAYMYGSYDRFRKKNMGRVILTDSGVPLDMAWQELAEMYPAYFDNEVNEGDQPVMLMEIIDSLQNTYVADEFYGYYSDMIAQDLMTKVYEGYWDVSALHTVADVKQKEINLLRAKHLDRMDELRQSHKESENKLRQEHKEQIAQLRTQYKEREEAKIQKVAQYYQKSRKEAVDRVRETREKRDAITKLQSLVLDTAKWVSYPKKDDVKCPDIIRGPYAEFLSSIDLSSKRLLNGGEPTKNDLRVASAMDSLAKAIEKKLGTQSPDTETETVLDTGYLDLPVHFVENLKELAENLKKRMDVVDGHIVNSMTSDEIKALTKFIRTLNHSIKEMSTLYANMRFARVEQLGNDSMLFLKDLGEAKQSNAIANFVTWDNALPYYTFKRFGVAGESVFEELMDAQDKLAYLADEIFKFREKTWTDKESIEWSNDTHTIELPSGRKVTLTSADAMSIYCLARREQGKQHLLGGGVRVLGIEKNGKKANDSRSLLNEQDILAIASSLTERQKQVAEAIQEYMSTVCSEWGNEISMKRFLTKEFTEKFYFPIESNDENLDTKDPKAQQSDLYRLLNISATKPLTKGANNEVIIRNVFDVFANHSSDMARLNAYGMALLDYMKWINYREKTVNDDGQISVSGVRKSMEKAYGPEAKKYVIGLIKDINGRYNDNGDNKFLMKMLRGAKTAMVGASLRVAALQVTAYPRAAMVLSNKSLVLGLTKAPQIEKAKKYCGIALWKSFGFYDTNISKSIEEQIKGTTNIRQKLIELSLKGAEWGDAITWGALWNACEYEVAKTKQYKVGSEEFNQAVGKKLREVVYASQVVDSTLTRSQMMRSKSGLTQTASAFMSEPTVSANILMDSAFQFNLEKRRTGSAKLAWQKTSKHIGKAVAVYSVGQIFAALVEGLMDAYRDDDDEEFKDKFGEAFKENAISDINPFNKIPIIADVSDLIMSWFGIGFSSSNSLYLQAIDEASNAFDIWSKVINGEDGKTVYAGIYSTTKLLSYITGVSASGLMREAVTLWNNTAGAADPYLKVRTYETSATDRGIAEYKFDKGDTASVKTTVSKMVADKVKSGKTEKEAKSAVRSSFTSTYKPEYMAAVKAKDYDEMNRIRKFLYATGLYGTLSELDETLKKWRTAE